MANLNFLFSQKLTHVSQSNFRNKSKNNIENRQQWAKRSMRLNEEGITLIFKLFIIRIWGN